MHNKPQKRKDRAKKSREKVLKLREKTRETARNVRKSDRPKTKSEPIRNDSLSKTEWDNLLDNMASLMDAKDMFEKEQTERKEKQIQIDKLKQEGKTPEEIKAWLEGQVK